MPESCESAFFWPSFIVHVLALSLRYHFHIVKGNEYSACRDGLFQRATSNYHYAPSTCGVEVHHTTGTSAWPSAPSPSVDFPAYFTEFSVEWNATDAIYAINGTVRESHGFKLTIVRLILMLLIPWQVVNHIYVGMPGWSAPFQLPTWDMYLIISQGEDAHVCLHQVCIVCVSLKLFSC